MNQAQLTYPQLAKLYVGGTFGYFLNIKNAQSIGLLPNIDPELIVLSGNTALAGCEEMLLSSQKYHQTQKIKDKMQIINMSYFEEFDNYFLLHLFLTSFGEKEQ